MTNPYRAALKRLMNTIHDLRLEGGNAGLKVALNTARALLAEADRPAVSNDGEPASVAMQPNDTELLELMPETMRDEFSYAANICSDATGGKVRSGIFRVCLNTAALEYARAVLARWGRPAAAPVPEPGEVAELVAWLRDRAESTSLAHAALRITRAATLLQQQDAPAPVTVPVPVSERLPGPEDCDDQGRCWMFGKVEGDWRLISRIDPGIPKLRYCFSHWLPANALPLPAPEGEEVG